MPPRVLIGSVRADLCLGFANTLSWRGRAAPSEALRDFRGLLAWVERSAQTSAGAADGVALWSRAHPGKAAGVFAEAIALRELLNRVFGAAAAGDPAVERDIAALSAAIAEAPARRRLARVEGGHAWQIDALRPRVADVLAPVLWSAADLLLDAPRRRIRQCANHQCLWLFLDASKSGTRRWCDMASCGNRAKAERHYAKVRKSRT